MHKLLLVALLYALSACAHSVHLVHSSDWDKSAGKTKIVEAQSEQFVIFGFVRQTDYVNHARKKLLSQCKGPISAVTTEYRTSLGFFSWHNKIIMRGLCSAS